MARQSSARSWAPSDKWNALLDNVRASLVRMHEYVRRWELKRYVKVRAVHGLSLLSRRWKMRVISRAKGKKFPGSLSSRETVLELEMGKWHKRRKKCRPRNMEY